MFGLNKTDRRRFGKSGRLIRIFSPFVLLVVVLVAFYFVTSMTKSESENETADNKPSPSMKPTGNANTSTTASPTSHTNVTITVTQQSNKVERTPLPPMPPINAQIQLIGPPPDSSFHLEDPLSTIWTWPLPQEAGQQFAVFLVTDENEFLAGTVKDPSLGDFGYQLTYSPGDVVNSEGTYLLQIRLQQTMSQIDLVTSIPRKLTFSTSSPR